ncbi:maleylacetate reductase [Burkholderia pyrrocinia]|uniref:maleylacetate reductase n=1 Tax=Burkholderia pyrrocinia TaxID=60550 RepID=UPI0015766AAB|nr:maleylacetate reductase [Burkholderia pyrrocinia]NTX26953.1 maleylacetate reductase [Burkholderia pyrrocinia]
MYDFIYTSQPSKVIFGAGSLARVEEEVQALGARKALVLCTPEQEAQATEVAHLLGPLSAGVFPEARMHVPIETARRARDHAREVGADCAVAIGGGSTVGLGKAIALESSLPIIAIPTTYAGSEMTPIYGVTEDGLKRTGRDARVLPKTVIYDPMLSLNLPLALSFVSGINAIAHAAEGLYARDGNPVMSLMAEDGIRSMAAGLRGLQENSQSLAARSECLYGAWLCGNVLGHVGMALHHKLCHTLGGSFNLPHAETHAIVLPHALAYNSDAAPDAMRRISRALGSQSAALGVFELGRDLGIPSGLREIGMQESDLERACEIALANPYWNPRPIERDPLLSLLHDAWTGSTPR